MDEVTVFDWLTLVGAWATPVVAGLIAFLFSRRHARNEALTQARVEVYRELAPLLNRIVTYFGFLGRWKETSPPELIELKRRSDDVFFAAAPLFGRQTVSAYQAFINSCFDTSTPLGEEPRLRTTADLRRDVLAGWDDAWEAMFDSDLPAAHAQRSAHEIRQTYSRLTRLLVQDIKADDGKDEHLSRRVGTEEPTAAR